MEMRLLSEVSFALLTDAQTRGCHSDPTWKEAFEACGSPSDWLEYHQKNGSLPTAQELWSRYEEAALRAGARPAFGSSVTLPEF